MASQCRAARPAWSPPHTPNQSRQGRLGTHSLQAGLLSWRASLPNRSGVATPLLASHSLCFQTWTCCTLSSHQAPDSTKLGWVSLSTFAVHGHFANLSAVFYGIIQRRWDKHVNMGCFESGVVQNIGIDTKPCLCKNCVCSMNLPCMGLNERVCTGS